MALSRDEDKPWKTNLARKSAARREQVLHDVEEAVKKAASFEDALRQAAELMKKRFARGRTGCCGTGARSRWNGWGSCMRRRMRRS